jgi:hypothetical protein
LHLLTRWFRSIINWLQVIDLVIHIHKFGVRSLNLIAIQPIGPTITRFISYHSMHWLLDDWLEEVVIEQKINFWQVPSLPEALEGWKNLSYGITFLAHPCGIKTNKQVVSDCCRLMQTGKQASGCKSQKQLTLEWILKRLVCIPQTLCWRLIATHLPQPRVSFFWLLSKFWGFIVPFCSFKFVACTQSSWVIWYSSSLRLWGFTLSSLLICISW